LGRRLFGSDDLVLYAKQGVSTSWSKVPAPDETEVRGGAGSTRSSRKLPWGSEHLAVTGSVDEQHWLSALLGING
jgi:hypothetical protein